MNTTVRVEGAGRDLEPFFRRVEATLTRFDPESPLSRLNRMDGRWVVVPPLLHLAIRRALRAARLTGGAFDPTILPALVAAGYGRSFEQGPTETGPAQPAGRWREVQVGPGAVWLPPGVQIDLGGIGKGLAADLALRRAWRDGGPPLLVDVGGDIALWAPETMPPWLVEVEDPFDPARTLAVVALRSEAAATSSTLGRRWGEGLHHLIDPWTGRPSESSLVSATVFAPSAAMADVLAKACILLGPERALPLLSARRCHGLMVTRAGRVIQSPGLEEFLCASAE
ncbi:MAG: FAD:protein FMN transferase [Bacillota bacterium]